MSFEFISNTCDIDQFPSAFSGFGGYQTHAISKPSSKIYPNCHEAEMELTDAGNHDRPRALYYLSDGNSPYLTIENAKLKKLRETVNLLVDKKVKIREAAIEKALTLKTKKCISCGESVKTSILATNKNASCPYCGSQQGFPFNKGDISKINKITEKREETRKAITEEEFSLASKLAKKKDSPYKVRVIVGTWVHCDEEDDEGYDY